MDHEDTPGMRARATVPIDAGYVALVNCTRMSLKNSNLTNNEQSVLLAFTTNSTISGNNITNNMFGIFIHAGSGNTIFGNNIMTNHFSGLYLWDSSNNTIYHNNFINYQQVFLSNSANNTWDNGCEGNYWSSFGGSDSDGDGIGDTPYMLDGSNQDQYPLMNPYWNPSDINHDLIIDIFDIVRAAGAYGSTPLDTNWNPHCDIAEAYGIIDIFDIVTIAMSYGKEYVP